MTNYNALRRQLLLAARHGRASCLPAGGRDNKTALVLIHGEAVGQASTLMHYVREAPDAPRFGKSILLPGYDHQIPEELRDDGDAPQ
ncbi:hypothetical protein H7J86_32270 [Mycobacterium hackensackense]|uniref:hypothetical protein n=1 Tax=Mycobacterium hackensackense TaxID=228909 RepID=UPI002265A305|nr:hypothetical protein [Mycobacterium hackensackense]MCV7256862.1 hypothetical protein [Mycobacterium hackensackense]